MGDVVGDLEAQQAELSDLVDRIDGEDWGRPSRCAGWSVGDVVLHLAQTNELALASATDRYREVLGTLSDGLAPAADVDEGAAAMVVRDRVGTTPAAVLARWHRSADDLVDALRKADPATRVEWVAGTFTARTLATTRLAETWIHTGDVFATFGPEPTPSDRLWHVARLAWRTLPYAFRRAGRPLHGPVAFHLVGPSGDQWRFEPDQAARTTVSGSGTDLCRVASRRVRPSETGLQAEGPDAADVLDLVRTWA